jgi:hypothetical protein
MLAVRRPYLMALLILLGLAGRASANSFRLEAENYTASGNIPGCGLEVKSHDCSEASGGLALDGMDCDGEWIELHLVLYRGLALHCGVRSAGSIGCTRTFGVRFLLDDESEALVAADTLTTPQGTGVG